MILISTSCQQHKKPKLPLELEAASSNADHVPQEENVEAAMDETMQKMVAIREKLKASAAQNIKDAQARYKKDYDKKRGTSEVHF